MIDFITALRIDGFVMFAGTLQRLCHVWQEQLS